MKKEITKTKSTPRAKKVADVGTDIQAPVYTMAGKESGNISLPSAIFGVKANKNLLAQVVTSMRSNMRAGTAHTKFRGEVRGGGKKPWKQKGTGRARHGSTRSPIWVGGGTTHGPRSEKNYDRKINKKSLTKALFGVLSQKLKDNELIFVDSFEFATPKTKSAQAALTSIAKSAGAERLASAKRKAGLILLPTSDKAVVNSFRNLPSVSVEQWRNLNPYLALSYKYIVIAEPKNAIAFFETKLKK